MTNLERLQLIGIKRLGSPKRGFRYRPQSGRLTKADLDRIRDLKIPPAWTEVAVNPAAKGRLQAVGKDAAGRWQYLYHADHTRLQEIRKFKRLGKFARALPKLRVTISRHLRQPGLGRERVLAAILRILSTCYMRPGSRSYASEHGSYGIATLRRKHVTVKGDLIDFDFPGKSGVRQQRQLRDRQVAKVVRESMKLAGYNVFKFENEEGKIVNVTRQHINMYIKEIMGERFSAKDFRTWAGTLVCACALSRAGVEMPEESTIRTQATVRKRRLVAAIKETAEVLGNTPAVCRSSYVCPDVISEFEKGKVIENCYGKLEDLIAFRGRGLHEAERALLKFLGQNGTRNAVRKAVGKVNPAVTRAAVNNAARATAGKDA
ncbi:MAG: DNA topoisomerase IB [Acidobacteria bacterium]|nr:DNA topoisomerase IB [Acidobacteriota bacterium]